MLTPRPLRLKKLICCRWMPIGACCPWSHGLRQEKIYASVTVPPTPLWIPSQWPLAQSVTPIGNDKGDNFTDLLAFILRFRKTVEIWVSRMSDEICRISHHLKWGPLPPNDIGRIAQQTREGNKRIKWGGRRRFLTVGQCLKKTRFWLRIILLENGSNERTSHIILVKYSNYKHN